VRGLLPLLRWELRQSGRSRLLQGWTGIVVLGSGGLLAAFTEGPALLTALLLAILFFGSLAAFLFGWARGGEARDQGALLFAQPIGPGTLLAGKLLGAGVGCGGLLVVVLAPAALQGVEGGALALLWILGLAYLLIFALGGVLIGLMAERASGLLGGLLAWGGSVVGWEMGLALLTGWSPVAQVPGLFLILLLANPAGAFRVGSTVGLDVVPVEIEGLEAWGWLLGNAELAALAISGAWIAALLAFGVWAVGRLEF